MYSNTKLCVDEDGNGYSEGFKMYLEQVIHVFVINYIHGVSGLPLLIESIDSMTVKQFVCN